MTIQEIEALKRLSLDQLVTRAQELGYSITDIASLDVGDGRWKLLTRDAIRLKIIDRQVELELRGSDDPTVEVPRHKEDPT
jgi:hypothetical protein